MFSNDLYIKMSLYIYLPNIFSSGPACSRLSILKVTPYKDENLKGGGIKLYPKST